MSNQTEIQQDSMPIFRDGDGGKIRLNRRGEVYSPDWVAQLAIEGVVFNASNAVQETLEDISETSRAATNTAPALLLDVPLGSTAILLEVMLDQGSDGADEDIAVTINTDDKVRYSSGGAAITPINMNKSDPMSSACVFYSGSSTITAAANTDDDTIYSAWMTADALPKSTNSGLPTVMWTAKKFVPPVLVGPASVQVFVVSATADQTWMYSVKWAEFQTRKID